MTDDEVCGRASVSVDRFVVLPIIDVDAATLMDDLERAEAQEQQWRDLTLAAARRKVQQPALLMLYCLNCGTALPLPPFPLRRWCDAECRDDWEARQ